MRSVSTENSLLRSFSFEARQHGRRVTGRISALTVFGAMRILRLTGLEAIRIRELEDMPAQRRAASYLLVGEL